MAKLPIKHLNDQEWAEQAQRLAGLETALEKKKEQKRKDTKAINAEIKALERELREVTRIVMTREMEVPEEDVQPGLFAKGASR